MKVFVKNIIKVPVQQKQVNVENLYHNQVMNIYYQNGNLDKKTFDYNCKEMEEKILKDNPVIYKEQLTKKCKKGYYKGSVVTDPGNTFHFYRQDPDGKLESQARDTSYYKIRCR